MAALRKGSTGRVRLPVRPHFWNVESVRLERTLYVRATVVRANPIKMPRIPSITLLSQRWGHGQDLRQDWEISNIQCFAFFYGVTVRAVSSCAEDVGADNNLCRYRLLTQGQANTSNKSPDIEGIFLICGVDCIVLSRRFTMIIIILVL